MLKIHSNSNFIWWENEIIALHLIDCFPVLCEYQIFDVHSTCLLQDNTTLIQSEMRAVLMKQKKICIPEMLFVFHQASCLHDKTNFKPVLWWRNSRGSHRGTHVINLKNNDKQLLLID